MNIHFKRKWPNVVINETTNKTTKLEKMEHNFQGRAIEMVWQNK